jgi:hypothetical protein
MAKSMASSKGALRTAYYTLPGMRVTPKVRASCKARARHFRELGEPRERSKAVANGLACALSAILHDKIRLQGEDPRGKITEPKTMRLAGKSTRNPLNLRLIIT